LIHLHNRYQWIRLRQTKIVADWSIEGPIASNLR
jgi:hypothetical protein